MSFSIPGCFMGILGGYISNYILIEKLTESVDIEYDHKLPFTSYLIIIAVGILVPFIVSFLFSLYVC
jgi:hypothetical protein